MNRLPLILTFILVNALGFFSVHICFLIGKLSGVISPDSPEFDPAAVAILFQGVIMTWIICAVFSFAAFFVQGAGRIFFLAAPVVIPIGYGLKLLFLPL